tara:strand:+ start:228 stop:548 length:321 start_codon:yes stop_codon:yes gene_type:complete
MDSFLEKIISEINIKSASYQKQIKQYVSSLKGSSSQILDSSKIKIEIKKIEFEIKNIQKKIGKYVSDQYLLNNATDYTYDEKFIEKNDEIKKLKNYLNTLRKQKNN